MANVDGGNDESELLEYMFISSLVLGPSSSATLDGGLKGFEEREEERIGSFA